MSPRRSRDQPASGRQLADVTVLEITVTEDPGRRAQLAHRMAVLRRLVVALAVSAVLAAAAVAAVEGWSTGRASYAVGEVAQQESPALDPIAAAFREAAARSRSRLAAARAAGALARG